MELSNPPPFGEFSADATSANVEDFDKAGTRLQSDTDATFLGGINVSHGNDHLVTHAPRSRFYQGGYGRLFPELPPWEPGAGDGDFLTIANKLMIEEAEKTPKEIADDPDLIKRLEAKFNSEIPAGYTYFGQFVDHDITFDPTSSLMRRSDPEGLVNFRTPRLDLDNVYGRGPDDQPYLYDPDDKAKLVFQKAKRERGRTDLPDLPDLPRYGNVAIIGDMRNDENSIVSQLQLAFILAHNTLVHRARAADPGASTGEIFERARRTLRWLYQHIVWHDFVLRIVDDNIHAFALKLEQLGPKGHVWTCGLSDIYQWKQQPFMPVEFSVAAYRFGHSMVRNAYRTNFPAHNSAEEFIALFDPKGDDLRGGRPMRPKNSIQWDWFLPMQSSRGPFPQRARKIDTRLSNALAFLGGGPSSELNNVLAARNLQRGVDFRLPSGTDVARKLCLEPVALDKGEPDALWYYILKEAETTPGPSLGPVGSMIVASVFAGLLHGDPNSYFNVNPTWKPEDDPLLNNKEDNVDDSPDWKLASIIRLSGLQADGIGIEPDHPNAEDL